MSHLIHINGQAQVLLLGGGGLLVVFAVLGVLLLPQMISRELTKPIRIILGLIGVGLFFLGATASTAPEQLSPSSIASSQGTPASSPTRVATSPIPTIITTPVTTTPPCCPPSASPTFTYIQEDIQLEGEDGTGDGEVMQRGAASQERTIWLHAGESRHYRFKVVQGGHYRFILVRYSNDNTGPLEHVTLRVDKFLPVQFTAQDTGNYGLGWNIFKHAKVKALGFPNLAPGMYSLTISVAGGDGYGVEIDYVKLM